MEAGGVVEASRVDGVAEVTVELVGLAGSGRVVSHGRPLGGHLLPWDARPVAVRVRPTGQEDRFALQVWSFTWEGTRISAEQ